MHPLHRWTNAPKRQRQHALKQLFNGTWPPAFDYVTLVTIPGQGGIFASLGPHFHYAIFGRDSIETAEDLLETHQQLVHDTILVLCRLQGTAVDAVSEEEPGKIHHEYRTLRPNGMTIPIHSEQIMRGLQHIWGGQGTDSMTYYGTHDATPLFIRLVGSYVAHYGATILDETYTRKNGTTATVRDSILAANDWLVRKIEVHPLRLFAYKHINPNGITNQDWKDSYTSHIHADGSLPNFEGGIAAIELQGYAYDALCTVLDLHLGTQAERHQWSELANHIQHQTIASFWMFDSQYFAQALDFDNNNEPRQLATITSDAGALLDSRLIHDLPAHDAAYYAKSIASVVYGPELLTGIGIRCRAVRYWDLIDFIDYHGPNAVWPKETFDIAKGFRRSGMHALANDLEQRIIISLEQAGEFSEFFYVSRDGTVWYDSGQALAHFGAESPGHHLPTPEPGQAWTIAAALRIAASRASKKYTSIPATDFEQALLTGI